jgi:hypothetical protein
MEGRKDQIMITNATIEELEAGLKTLNELFNNNIVFNNGPERISRNRSRFTLKCKDSSGPGARLGHSGRKMISACWHVHGKLFDILIHTIRGNIFIKAGARTIDSTGGNWEDWNIGSVMHEFYYSEACLCGLDTQEEKDDYIQDRKNINKAIFNY